MLSIVVPAYNEEKYLPGLLDSIKSQKIECEIIIADKNSEDKTRAIAKKHNCKIVSGGSPSAARNNGAKSAKHDLLFLDADVVMPKGFLKKFLFEIEKNSLDFATCRLVPISHESSHRFVYMMRNMGNMIFPHHVSGQCLFVKRTLFIKAGGYDESIVMGEEHDLAARLEKHGRGKYFMSLSVFNHPRRLEKEGAFRSLAKDFYSEAYRMFIGKADHELYKKEYGHY